MNSVNVNKAPGPSPTPSEDCKYDTDELPVRGYYLLLNLVLTPAAVTHGGKHGTIF